MSIFARGRKLYAKIKDVAGKWQQVATGFDVGQEAEAAKWLATQRRRVESARAAGATDGPLTVSGWAKTWIAEQRARGVVNAAQSESWLESLVLPEIGSMPVSDIRTHHLVALFARIRVMPLKTGKPRAPRTLHNIHAAVRSMLRDAVMSGHLDHEPVWLDERQLGRKADADPEWRASALFTRDEVQTLISTPLIPADRRMAYAIELLAGLRPGEAAAQRWRHYEPAREPLGMLRVAKAYSKHRHGEKGTKTGAVKAIPVHPTLAAMLAEWKLGGWEATNGRAPGADDLIVPIPPDDAKARTHRDGEPWRTDYYARRRWVDEDLPALGWRHRRHYDTRATFITLAVEDGARVDIIRERVTHTRPMRSGFDFYDRGDHWRETCAEVAKLRIVRTADAQLRAVEGGRR